MLEEALQSVQAECGRFLATSFSTPTGELEALKPVFEAVCKALAAATLVIGTHNNGGLFLKIYGGERKHGPFKQEMSIYIHPGCRIVAEHFVRSKDGKKTFSAGMMELRHQDLIRIGVKPKLYVENIRNSLRDAGTAMSALGGQPIN